MKYLLFAAAVMACAAGLAHADDAPAPAKPLTAQQQKMKDCNATAKTRALSGDERKAFMKTCLSKNGGVAAPAKPTVAAAPVKAKAAAPAAAAAPAPDAPAATPAAAADSPSPQTAQQQKMKDCNTRATAQNLKGDDRRSFLGSCLKD